MRRTASAEKGFGGLLEQNVCSLARHNISLYINTVAKFLEFCRPTCVVISFLLITSTSSCLKGRR